MVAVLLGAMPGFTTSLSSAASIDQHLKQSHLVHEWLATVCRHPYLPPGAAYPVWSGRASLEGLRQGPLHFAGES